MEGHKVIITTSGIGSRLGQHTKFTNKSLVRIGDMPSISHIIEHYPENTEFVITLGHFGDQVRQFLTLVYPSRKFDFVEVDRFKGNGSSLGYSLLKCRKSIDRPFIFHASDTILTDSEYSNLEKNLVVGIRRKENSQYRTISSNKNNVSRINEKGEIGYDQVYVGVCKIMDFERFFNNLSELVESDRFGSELSDVHVINEMIADGAEFTHIHTGEWYDVGNTNELERARTHFDNGNNVLDKPNESIYFIGDEVIKFFSDEKTNLNRVNRSKNLAGLVPAVTGHTKNFYKYKKVEGETLSHNTNTQNFKSLLEWATQKLWERSETAGFKDTCRKFYEEKTKNRVNQYLNGREDKEERINGIKIPPVKDLLSSIDFDWISDGIPTRFHGDFILENIIHSDGTYTLIDWRQDFEGQTSYGDLYYDLAKLNHNLIVNHDIVKRGLYTNEFSEGGIKCEILIGSDMLNCREIYHNFIKENGFDLRKVKVLTALIWLNMSPLHEHPFDSFLFQFGKYNLYRELYES